MPDKVVEYLTFKQGTVRLVSNLSSLGVVSIGAGLLTAGIAAWDTLKLAQNNDIDASIAMGIVTAGTLVTTIATGLFKTSSPVLFGMGPIAWIGIGIAVTGFALYILFKDSPMEVWLKNGPFGADPSTDYSHLQDPSVAFERFVGLIFSLSIKPYQLGTQTVFSEEVTNRLKTQGVTHIIHLDTNLAALLNVNSMDIEFYARQAIQQTAEVTSRATAYGQGPDIEKDIINISKHDLTIIHQEVVKGGYAFCVQHDLSIPAPYSEYNIWKGRSYKYKFSPAFIIRARLQVEGFYLPTPSLEKQGESIPPTDKPSFTSDDELWIKTTLPA